MLAGSGLSRPEKVGLGPRDPVGLTRGLWLADIGMRLFVGTGRLWSKVNVRSSRSAPYENARRVGCFGILADVRGARNVRPPLAGTAVDRDAC